MHRSIYFLGLALAASGAACAARAEPGLANARRLDNVTQPDPRVTDVVANADDSCDREEGTVLRNRVPACPRTEKKPNADLALKLAGRPSSVRVPWPPPEHALWTCVSGAHPFLAWVANVGAWSSAVSQSPASSAIACAMPAETR